MDKTSSIWLFPVVGTFCIAVIVGVIMWLLRNKNTPWWVDTVCAVFLLLLSAVYLVMLYSIQSLLPSNTYAQKQLLVNYKVALYIVPFFTAGIATNILSYIITYNRHYESQMSLKDGMKVLGRGLLLIICFCSIIGAPIYMVCVKGGISLRRLRPN